MYGKRLNFQCLGVICFWVLDAYVLINKKHFQQTCPVSKASSFAQMLLLCCFTTFAFITLMHPAMRSVICIPYLQPWIYFLYLKFVKSSFHNILVILIEYSTPFV